MVCEEEGGGESNQKSWVELKVRLVCTFRLYPARAGLSTRNGLVNEVEFLGLIPQKW